MATQQHPAFDSNPTLAAGGSLRTSAWHKDFCAKEPRSAGRVSYDQLRVAALVESQSWKVLDKGKSARNGSALTLKWDEAKTSVEKNLQILRNLVSTGHKLQGDAEILLANSNIL